MKIKSSILACSVIFLMSCGSGQPKEQSPESAPAATNEKFIIKAFNMQYISLAANKSLIANQPDPTKAEVFEKVEAGSGKYFLKASNGLFVCDDRMRGDTLFADKPHSSDWETFEIIAVDQSRVNIKSSDNKFVTSDLGTSGIINATSKTSSDWELFTLEPK